MDNFTPIFSFFLSVLGSIWDCTVTMHSRPANEIIVKIICICMVGAVVSWRPKCVLLLAWPV